MAPPRVTMMPPGGFSAWMKARGRLGGQNKVPRIIQDQHLFNGLLDLRAAMGRRHWKMTGRGKVMRRRITAHRAGRGSAPFRRNRGAGGGHFFMNRLMNGASCSNWNEVSKSAASLSFR